MNSEEFDALPEREVDALIAEKVIGITVTNAGGEFYSPGYGKVPYYCTDLNACEKLHGALPVEGDTSELFCKALLRLTDGYKMLDDPSAIIWEGCFATARQKCKAALMAVGIINDAVAASGKEDVG